jgi:serine/threonine-protein kinase
MGVVYRARDAELGRPVALKILSSSVATRPTALARFKLEAQAACQVVHQNVVNVYAFGVDRGVPYMAMEYLKGETLSGPIARGPLSVDRAADVMLAVCSGVHSAHREGIVHRDLKPSNIFLAQTPLGEVPKVLDFGISKLADRADDPNLTESGAILGTQYYLSPEQAAGRPDVDGRSDQYSLGVILYEAVTGRLPHEGDTTFVLLRNIVEGRFQPPSRHRADLPPAFEALVMRAMSLDPAARFPSVRELGRALLALASERGRRQWGDHYAQPEAQPVTGPAAEGSPRTGSGSSNRPPAGLRAPAPTQVLPEDGRPETWQIRPTHTAGGDDAPAPAGPSRDTSSLPPPAPGPSTGALPASGALASGRLKRRAMIASAIALGGSGAIWAVLPGSGSRSRPEIPGAGTKRPAAAGPASAGPPRAPAASSGPTPAPARAAAAAAPTPAPARPPATPPEDASKPGRAPAAARPRRPEADTTLEAPEREPAARAKKRARSGKKDEEPRVTPGGVPILP